MWCEFDHNRATKIKRIEERPHAVETREHVGDWEGDTVVGKEKTRGVFSPMLKGRAGTLLQASLMW